MATKFTPRQTADNQQRKTNANAEIYQSEKRVAQSARSLGDHLNNLGFNPAEQSLLSHPTVGRTLLAGGEINGSDIPDEIRSQLGIGRTQRVSLPPEVLRRFAGVQVSSVSGPSPDMPTNLQPINSLGELINPHRAVPSTAPTGGIQQTSGVAEGLQQMIQQIMNQLAGQANAGNLNSGVVGLGNQIVNPIPSNPAPVQVNTQTGTGVRQEPSILDRLSTPEGAGITINEIMSALRGILPQSSNVDETKILEAATRAFPQLAKKDKSLTAKKGLQKFSGAGEFKVNGNRYKIEGSKIIKVG